MNRIGQAHHDTALGEVLARDLTLSGFFRVLEPQAYIEGPLPIDRAHVAPTEHEPHEEAARGHVPRSAAASNPFLRCHTPRVAFQS